MADSATHPEAREASVRKPLTDPIVLNRPARHVAGGLRVTLLNAAGAVLLDGITACLQRRPLNSSSIILLCESDWGTRRADGLETAAELAQRLNMSFAYMGAFGIPVGDGTYRSMLGNAILSTSPLTEVRGVAMPMPHPERRPGALHGRVGTPAGLVVKARFRNQDLTVGVAHLASHPAPSARDEQMAAYLAEFPAQGPAIFGGDLNTTTTDLLSGPAYLKTFGRMLLTPWRFHSPQRYEPLFKRLAAAGLRIEGVNRMRKPTFTFARAIPPIFRPKLDWLAVRDLNPVSGSARVVPARPSFFSKRVSDHDFVTVELEL